MKGIIRCINKDCGYEEPASGRERISKGRAVTEQGQTVLCSVCGCQTILIDDK